MAYEPKYTKPYEGGYQDFPSKETPVTAEILNSLEDSVTSVEEQLKKTTEIYDTNKINLGRAITDTNTVPYNVALGYNNTASGYASFAEGIGNTVTGQYGHVEGAGNTVAAIGAHAEGQSNTVDGSYSHVEGTGNKASSSNQHVQGKFNEEDTNGRFAHIVGGGTSDTARKNIHTVDWNGNAYFAGEVEGGNGNYLSRKAQGISVEIDAEALTIQLLTSAGIVCGTAELTADELKEVLEIYTLMDDVEELKNAKDITTTTSPTMQNSYPGRVLINEIGGGETQQGTVAGNQLFDVSKLKGTTVTADEDGWIEVSYDNTAGTSEYYMSVNVPASDLLAVNTEYAVIAEIESIDGMSLELVSHVLGLIIGQFSTSVYYNAPGTKIANVTTRESFDNCNTMLCTMCTFPVGSSGSAKFRISVLADTTVTADTFVYEKFTGGIPSPNPEYPQEIEATVVSEIKTVGKNLFNKEKAVVKAQTTFDDNGNETAGASYGWFILENYIKVKPNTVYTLTGKILPINWSSKFVLYDVDLQPVSMTPYVNKNNVYTFETGQNVHYFRFSMYANNDYTDAYDADTIQLEEGSVATDYEPYTETVQKLSSPITLYNYGGVKDTFNPKQKNKRFGVAVFDGSEEWIDVTANYTNKTEGQYRYVLTITDLLFYKRTTIGIGTSMTNYGVPTAITATAKYSDNGIGLYHNNDMKDVGRYLYVTSSDITSVDELREKLANVPLVIVAELDEPVIEPLPTAYQIALNSLPTYSTVTHLLTDAEIEPTYELKYGTSEVGGYTLEGLLAGRNGELTAQNNAERLTALEAAVVSNI